MGRIEGWDRPTVEHLVAAASELGRRAAGELDRSLGSLRALPASSPLHACAEPLGIARDAIGALGPMAPEGTPITLATAAVAQAMSALAVALRDLQTVDAPGEADDVTAAVARTMAQLHPLHRGLERLLGPEEELRVAPAPSTARPVLELVGEQDEPEHVGPAADAQDADGQDPDAQDADADRGGDPLPLTERRGAARIELSVDIGYLGETNFFVGFSDDVSEGGLFVATHSMLPVGTSLLLSFVLPDGTPVTTGARVAWLRETTDENGDLRCGMGVAFEASLEPRGLAAIRRYVEVRAPLFHDADES